jgi:flavodoxin
LGKIETGIDPSLTLITRTHSPNLVIDLKILIIVHSVTGNTKKLADAIGDKAKAKGHSVNVVHLMTDPPIEGKGKDPKEFRIQNLPSASGYDTIIIGCPVWGANITPVMKKALTDLRGLQGKRVIPFTSQAFPFAFLGGNRVLRLISKEAEAKGAHPVKGASIQRMGRDLDKGIENASAKINSLL